MLGLILIVERSFSKYRRDFFEILVARWRLGQKRFKNTTKVDFQPVGAPESKKIETSRCSQKTSEYHARKIGKIFQPYRKINDF